MKNGRYSFLSLILGKFDKMLKINTEYVFVLPEITKGCILK